MDVDSWLEAAYEERHEAMFFEPPFAEEEFFYCWRCEDEGCVHCEDDYEAGL